VCVESDGNWTLAAGTLIEEGGFAKGLGMDAALGALRLQQVSAEIDFGGQVALLGREVSWRIADPRDRARPVVTWRIDGGSISTSGNSENARTVEGSRIGHLLDPRTGRPAVDFGSASVWCETAAAADAFSTAAFVMGPERALEWAAARPEVALLLLVVDGERLVARAESDLQEHIGIVSEGVSLSFVPSLPPRAR
jgi:thiamine biosynthesis lipoprotein